MPRRDLVTLLFSVLFLLPLQSQEPQLELEGDVTIVQVDRIVVVKEDRRVVKTPFKVKAPKGGILYRWSYPPTVDAVRKGNVLEIKTAPRGPLTVSVDYAVIKYDKTTEEIVTSERFLSLTFDVDAVVPPPPDPKPVPPTPDPKPVPPQPVSSFRVIFIAESAKTLTARENSVINAKVIRDYLNKETTTELGWQNWRCYDKDTPPDGDFPEMTAMWAATRPSVTAVPCVAIERNGRVEIVALAATPAEMVATFKKYKEGK